MDHLFVDADFEPGMCFLVETSTHCIDNKLYGIFNKKCDNFRVVFIFLGLKTNATEVKRKAEDDLCGVSKKIRKLNDLIENLLLDDNRDDTISNVQAIRSETSSEKRQTRSGSINGITSKGK